MSDKLDWLNKHFILLRHRTVQEAVEREKYKIRPDLAALVRPDMTSEEYLGALAAEKKYKDACDYLAYAMHRRAAVWWGYRCVVSLNEELEANPAAARDIADIGAPRPMPVPEWAKMPDTAAEEAAEEEASLKQAAAEQKKIEEMAAELKKQIPAEVQAVWDKAYGAINAEFKRVHGVTMEELVKKAAEKACEPLFVENPNSPLKQACDKLRADIEAKRKETVDLLKSVLPPQMPEHQRKMRDDALQAVYRWVVAPDEANSQAAMEVGNSCPDQPAGLLALSAFWSFGNLTPEGKQVIATPPGLAANGLCSALLQASLAPGGTRKYAERCQHYYELGLKVVWGEDNWGESTTHSHAPHAEPPAPEMPGAGSAPRSHGYAKWKPEPPVA